MPPSAFIEVRGLTYRYRTRSVDPVLRDIDLDLARDEALLIGGASGSGKSTLCRTFNGLIPHFFGGRLAGAVRVAGRPVSALSVSELFDRVGMVFQNPDTQLFCGSVAQEVAYGLESLGLDRRQIRSRIDEIVALLDIEALRTRAPHTLSGGEKHLVALAAILALKPAVLILDEPFANLDAHHVKRIREVLRQVRAAGRGVVICEHRLGPTLPDARRMLVMQNGRIAADGPVEAVLRQNDLSAWGLEVPLSVKIGRANQLAPLPRCAADLIAAIPRPAVDISTLQPAPPRDLSGAPVVLAVENLTARTNRRTLLAGVSFELHRGECLAVVGANGAGKTSLLRHLMGLARPAGGRIRLQGRDIVGRPVAQLAREVGLAFQNPDNQFFKLSVAEEIACGPRALGREDPGWQADLAARFGLAPYLARAPYRLSGGEKKRVAFAAALAARPAILALDEPTAGQDAQFRQALADLLVTLGAEGLSVIIVTHDLNFAARCAHRWLLMAEGRLLREGTPTAVMADAPAMTRAGLAPTEAFMLRQALGEAGRHV